MLVLKSVVASVLSLALVQAMEAKTYSKKLCDRPGFHCLEVEKGDTWKNLFPDENERDLVQKVNRTNTPLRHHQYIAVPNDLERATLFSLSPMPTRIEDPDENVVYVDLEKMAFGAYDDDGYLQLWGPISGGRTKCSDSNRSCKTVTGSFEVYREGTHKCASRKYPLGKGGAPMAYCMFFKGGYAMHVGKLPGFHASHGCVRLFYDDAKWLNKEFVEKGTKVIVGYESPEGIFDDRFFLWGLFNDKDD